MNSPEEEKATGSLPDGWVESVPPPQLNADASKSAGLIGLYWAIFLAVAGALVFVIAAGLGPALDTAAKASCRAMSPELTQRPAPELELQTLDGDAVRLSDGNGRFRVVNFWATWCEPCIEEWPDLDRLAARLGTRSDVEVWAISIDAERKSVAPFLERHSLAQTSVRVLFDPTQNAHKSFGSDKVPDTYFVDAKGDIRSVFTNVRAWGKPEAQRCVEAMVAQTSAH